MSATEAAYPTFRPISRRRLPIRTSSHSPAIGSGTSAGSPHADTVDRHPTARDRPAGFTARREEPRLGEQDGDAGGEHFAVNVNPPLPS